MAHTPGVPVVDISAFVRNGDLAARQSTASELAAKARVNGCVGITGHGISEDRLQKAFETTKRFFDLPYEDKMKSPHPDGLVPHRGFSGIGREQVVASLTVHSDDSAKKQEYANVKDYKESFELGSEENDIHFNIWPPEDTAPGFRDFNVSFYWELQKLSVAILDALAMSLNLNTEETKHLHKLHSGHDNQARLLHYPPADRKTLDDRSVTRLGAHRDWSSFTLLFQDAHGGLEFYDHQTDHFAPAVPTPGVLYMNIGDMFHRYSNGYYPSALHRVVLPEISDGDFTPPRYSIPYFVGPSPEEVIAPPPTVVATATGKVFDPVTFNSYATSLYEAIKT